MRIKSHAFHLVDPSPWPFLTCVSFYFTAISVAITINSNLHASYNFILAINLLCIVTALWWRDAIREGSYEGYHTSMVQKNLKTGFILFVVSEVCFFVSIFWAYFHSSLAPSVELAAIWPPKGIESLNPLEIPLLNTIILLSSGATVTWAHFALVKGNKISTLISFLITILLAGLFTYLQINEYYNAPFTFSDGIYGSCFYFGTGFHGFHVLIGTIFLMVGFLRIIRNGLTKDHHLGLESAIIYWHFVDVVWIFLFISVYWWAY